MKDYTIVTDSTADLPMNIINGYNIKVVTLSVILDDKQYRNFPDEREITNHELYEAMRDKHLPTTSAANISDFIEVLEPELKAGRDILYIGFSSALSCTYNVSLSASEILYESYPDSEIICIDSKCAALGLGLLVYNTVLLKEQGATLSEAAEYAENSKQSIIHTFTVDNLFHLMRGGRISKTTAFLGSMLSVKPILHVSDEGKLEPLKNVRGRKKSFNEIIEDMRTNIIDVTKPVFIGHADCLEDAEAFASLLSSELGVTNIQIGYIGAICGCHAGPETIAIFYTGRRR